MLFLSVRRFFDYAGPADHSRLSRSTVLPSPLRQKVGILKQRFFEAQSPGPPIPPSTLRAPPHDVTRKTRGQDGFAVLLSCRALSSPTTCRLFRKHSPQGVSPAGLAISTSRPRCRRQRK